MSSLFLSTRENQYGGTEEVVYQRVKELHAEVPPIMTLSLSDLRRRRLMKLWKGDICWQRFELGKCFWQRQ